ncbi:MAG: hypothetical protein MUF14_05045 [Hyphomonadaceae bacterium]|jgi:hypothetical protein|nr:hypothetical protein [Hyphomonadaceae bacterium]
MNTTFDPFWIASQLQLTPAQLLAVPFAVIAVLWLSSRMSQQFETANHGAASRTGQVLRFGVGFAGGVLVLLLAMNLLGGLAERLRDVSP